MDIDHAKFAKECILQGLYLGVNGHYLLAAALLRSGIKNDTDGTRIGPYRITQQEWDANSSSPELEVAFQPGDINSWRMQILFSAMGTLRAQNRLEAQLVRLPSAVELYTEQWPDDAAGMPARMQAALDQTRPIYLAAVNAVALHEPPPPALDGATVTPPGTGTGPAPTASSGQFAPLLDFIGRAESGANYNAYFGRPKNQSNPELISKTVNQVLAFQDQFVDQGSPSSAAGKYQIIRGTLRALVQQGKATAGDMFNQPTQDKLAVELMKQRGLDSYLAGTLAPEDFGVRLAMEWASMPVPKQVTKSNGAVVPVGHSYYAGDGLNHALVDVPRFMDAIGRVKNPANN